MAETPMESTRKSLNWFIKVCKLIWETRKYFWITIALSIVLNVFTAWLFTAQSTDFTKMPIGWAIQNRVFILFICIILILLYVIVYLGSHLPAGVSDKQLRRHYLQRVIWERMKLILTGIPAGLVAQSVPLGSG